MIEPLPVRTGDMPDVMPAVTTEMVPLERNEAMQESPVFDLKKAALTAKQQSDQDALEQKRLLAERDEALWITAEISREREACKALADLGIPETVFTQGHVIVTKTRRTCTKPAANNVLIHLHMHGYTFAYGLSEDMGGVCRNGFFVRYPFLDGNEERWSRVVITNMAELGEIITDMERAEPRWVAPPSPRTDPDPFSEEDEITSSLFDKEGASK